MSGMGDPQILAIWNETSPAIKGEAKTTNGTSPIAARKKWTLKSNVRVDLGRGVEVATAHHPSQVSDQFTCTGRFYLAMLDCAYSTDFSFSPPSLRGPPPINFRHDLFSPPDRISDGADGRRKSFSGVVLRQLPCRQNRCSHQPYQIAFLAYDTGISLVDTRASRHDG
jgi:hypothetical protein